MFKINYTIAFHEISVKENHKNALLLKVLKLQFFMKESDEILRSDIGYQLVVAVIILCISRGVFIGISIVEFLSYLKGIFMKLSNSI